jgi:hypothetical protein
MGIEKTERKLEGMWIPKNILILKDLSFQEKLFLVEIKFLDNDKGCYASNSHFAGFFGIGLTRTSQVINNLIKKNYITAEYIRKGEKVVKRVLTIKCMNLFNKLYEVPTEKCMKFFRKVYELHTGKCKGSNITRSIENSIVSKDTMGSTEKSASTNNVITNGLLGDIKEYQLPNNLKPALAICFSMKEMGLKTTLPKEGRPPSKTLMKSLKYLWSIKSGSFIRDISIDKEWAEKFNFKVWPDKNGYEKWSQVRNLVLGSLENMMKEKKENSLVGGSMWFPDKIETFLFNKLFGEQTGKSMFIKYMNVKVKTADDFITDFQKSGIGDKVKGQLEGLLEENNVNWTVHKNQRFWICMRGLVTWYKENREWIRKENKRREGGMFGVRMEDVNSFFLYLVIPYLKSIDPKFFSHEPLPVEYGNNPKWRRFCEWVWKKDSIKLDDWIYE